MGGAAGTSMWLKWSATSWGMWKQRFSHCDGTTDTEREGNRIDRRWGYMARGLGSNWRIGEIYTPPSLAQACFPVRKHRGLSYPLFPFHFIFFHKH